MGINVSTIGVGQSFDLDLMVNLGKAGGGSSRFISDREEMEEIFGSELDRMIVPAATNLQMSLKFPAGYRVLETWGHNHDIRGNEVRFSQPTLHHRDYETILVKVEAPRMPTAVRREIARFEMSFELENGQTESIGPLILERSFVSDKTPVLGFSEALVLRSGTMLHFAEDLIDIGDLYYSYKTSFDRINTLRDGLWRDSRQTEEGSYESLTNAEIRNLESQTQSAMQRAIDICVSSKKELTNARLRLDESGIDDEIEILDRYIGVLGREMELQDDTIAAHTRDMELDAIVDRRSLSGHIGNLFKEIGLSMSSRDPGVIAVSGFTARDDTGSRLLDFLNEMAVLEVAKFDGLKVVERSKIEKVMEEQKLSLSALVDTEKAIEIGGLLSANYILTGSLIEMPGSVVVFGRVINTVSGEIESVAQVILPKNAEVIQML